MTKSVLTGHNLLTPPGFEIHKNYNNLNEILGKIEYELEYPVIIKSTSSGASRGVSYVRDKQDVEVALESAYEFSDEVLIEKFIVGKEFSVGVVSHYLTAKALPVVQIITKNQFFDYDAKYTPGKADEVCPAEIDEGLAKKLQQTAVLAYRAVKAEVLSRIDLIVQDDKIYVLEVNTFPGLTSASIFPKELQAAGITLSSFLDEAIAEKIHK